MPQKMRCSQDPPGALLTLSAGGSVHDPTSNAAGRCCGRDSLPSRFEKQLVFQVLRNPDLIRTRTRTFHTHIHTPLPL